MQDNIIQLLVLAWINANTKRRAEYITELETVAAESGVNLFREVLNMVKEIAEAEKASKLCSQDYFSRNQIKPAQWVGDLESNTYFDLSSYVDKEPRE